MTRREIFEMIEQVEQGKPDSETYDPARYLSMEQIELVVNHAFRIISSDLNDDDCCFTEYPEEPGYDIDLVFNRKGMYVSDIQNVKNIPIKCIFVTKIDDWHDNEDIDDLIGGYIIDLENKDQHDPFYLDKMEIWEKLEKKIQEGIMMLFVEPSKTFEEALKVPEKYKEYEDLYRKVSVVNFLRNFMCENDYAEASVFVERNLLTWIEK